jgi:hypothetical protein
MDASSVIEVSGDAIQRLLTVKRPKDAGPMASRVRPGE